MQVLVFAFEFFLALAYRDDSRRVGFRVPYALDVGLRTAVAFWSESGALHKITVSATSFRVETR